MAGSVAAAARRRARRRAGGLRRRVPGLGGTEIAGAERAARRLLAHNPLRETGYGLLMQALAARGNVAEALAVYERARTVLRNQLGIPPGPAIHELHATLLGRRG